MKGLNYKDKTQKRKEQHDIRIYIQNKPGKQKKGSFLLYYVIF